jgi:hypothetical protein
LGFCCSLNTLARASAANKYESNHDHGGVRGAQALDGPWESAGLGDAEGCVALRHESTLTDA